MKFFYFELFKGKNQFFQSCSGFKFPNLWGGGGSDRGLEISKQFFFFLTLYPSQRVRYIMFIYQTRHRFNKIERTLFGKLSITLH